MWDCQADKRRSLPHLAELRLVGECAMPRCVIQNDNTAWTRVRSEMWTEYVLKKEHYVCSRKAVSESVRIRVQAKISLPAIEEQS